MITPGPLDPLAGSNRECSIEDGDNGCKAPSAGKGDSVLRRSMRTAFLPLTGRPRFWSSPLSSGTVIAAKSPTATVAAEFIRLAAMYMPAVRQTDWTGARGSRKLLRAETRMPQIIKALQRMEGREAERIAPPLLGRVGRETTSSVVTGGVRFGEGRASRLKVTSAVITKLSCVTWW